MSTVPVFRCELCDTKMIRVRIMAKSEVFRCPNCGEFELLDYSQRKTNQSKRNKRRSDPRVVSESDGQAIYSSSLATPI